MNIEVKGHSGCQIEIINNLNRLEICKSTSDKKYMDRLLLQARKQKEASDSLGWQLAYFTTSVFLKFTP